MEVVLGKSFGSTGGELISFSIPFTFLMALVFFLSSLLVDTHLGRLFLASWVSACAGSFNTHPLAMVKSLRQCVRSSLDRWVTIIPGGKMIGENVVYWACLLGTSLLWWSRYNHACEEGRDSMYFKKALRRNEDWVQGEIWKACAVRKMCVKARSLIEKEEVTRKK